MSVNRLKMFRPVKAALLSLCLLTAAVPAQAQVSLVRDTPYVQNVSTTSAIVAWFSTADGQVGQVDFGTTPQLGQKVTATTRNWPLLTAGPGMKQHWARLDGLKPGTRYYYRVSVDNVVLAPKEATAAPGFSFTTAPDSARSSITFGVMGDGGYGNNYQRAITGQMEKSAFEFIVNTGDVVYDYGADGEWHTNFYPVYKNLIRGTPWYLTLGNHDIRKRSDITTPDGRTFSANTPGAAYMENAFLPVNPSGSEAYYSFDWGPAHFTVLDSNRSFTPGGTDSEEYKWLEKDLQSANRPWKFVVFHHPMASIGKYAFTDSTLTALRRDWHPMFEKYGVNVVFSGHDHNYQRTYPVVIDGPESTPKRDDTRGIVHIVTGGGGAALTKQTVLPTPEWHTGQFQSMFHFLRIKLDPKRMQVEVVAEPDKKIGGEAVIVDQFEIANTKR